MSTPHLRLTEGMLRGASLAFIPGDPGRVPRIAAHLDSSRELARNREYVCYGGMVGDRPAIVCSGGIGGPSTAICLEELAQVGIRTIVRVGTTGTIQPYIAIGNAIICQAAVRLEGTSQHFAPIEFPAVADYAVTTALVKAAAASTLKHHLGITVTSDTFYPGQERYDTFTGRVLPRFQGSMQLWRELGALNFEMEAAAVFVACQALGLKAGCILGVVANRTHSEAIAEAEVEGIEEAVIRIAVAAISYL